MIHRIIQSLAENFFKIPGISTNKDPAILINTLINHHIDKKKSYQLYHAEWNFRWPKIDKPMKYFVALDTKCNSI